MEHWFSSDWHLSHERMRKVLRPEFDNIEKMDTKIIENMFENVSRGDQFYFLGDMIYSDKRILERILDLKYEKRLHFHWILGNHDDKVSKHILDRFSYCDSMKDIKIDGQKITLCHYPMISWNCSHYGAWQLFGHHHRKNYAGPVKIVGKQLNVNCEFNDFKPYNFEDIKKAMQDLPENWDLIKKS